MTESLADRVSHFVLMALASAVVFALGYSLVRAGRIKHDAA